MKTKEEVLEYIKKNVITSYSFKSVIGEYQNDVDVVLECVKKNSSVYRELTLEMMKNPIVFNTTLKGMSAIRMAKYAPKEAWTQENIDLFLSLKDIDVGDFGNVMCSIKPLLIGFASKKVSRIYVLIEKLSKELKEDKDIAIAFCKCNCLSFGDLNEKFRDDPEVLHVTLSGDMSRLLSSPLTKALPNALTKENVDLAFKKQVISSSDLNAILLNNKNVLINYAKTSNYDILRVFEKMPNTFKNDREVILAFVKNNPLIFKYANRGFRNDPEILSSALNSKTLIVTTYNPIFSALPGALTDENIDAAFKSRFIISDSDFSKEMLSNKKIIIKYAEKCKKNLDYYGPRRLFKKISIQMQHDKEVIKAMLDANGDLYSDIDKEFRKDPELLRLAISNSKFNNAFEYALEEAFDQRNIDLFIKQKKKDKQYYYDDYEDVFENNNFPKFLFKNRYYVTNVIKNVPSIYKYISKELKEDPNLINIAIGLKPKMLNYVPYKLITNELIDYAISKGYRFHYDQIKDTGVINSSVYLKRFLQSNPELYKYLPDRLKGVRKNINIILKKDIQNFSLIPEKYITDDLIKYAIENRYIVESIHYDIFSNYFSKILLNKDLNNKEKQTVFDLFINLKNNNYTNKLLYIIMRAIYKGKELIVNENNNPDVYKKYNDEINLLIRHYKSFNINKEISKQFINKVLNGEIDIYELSKVSSLKEMLYMININGIFGNEINRYHIVGRIKDFSYDILLKTNSKQLNDLNNCMKQLGGNNEILTLKMYSLLGYQRAKEVLTHKYGEVNQAVLERFFDDISCNEIVFEKDNNKFKPIINEQLINLLFGENYKVPNTPFKNFITNYKSSTEAYEKEIKKIEENDKLSLVEKIAREEKAKENSNNYIKELRTTLSNLSFIFNNWDIIEEEFLKRQAVTKLKSRMGLSQINEVVHNLKSIKNRIRRNYANESISEKNERISRIPGFEPRDFPLLKSDVFDYVGINIQYTYSPEKAPHRAVELSRMMEGKHSKKFPNVNIQYENYSINVLNPQDRNILSAGYKSSCCFRPNGNADNEGKNDSLLTYCSTNEYGGGIEVKNSEGKLLMFSPILRNGNVLMIHSFETSGLTEQETKIVNIILHEWAKKVIEESAKEEGMQAIVAVLMANLHPKRLDLNQCELVNNVKRFRVYDPDGTYRYMYNNLNEVNYALEYASNKSSKDIRYDFEIEHSYEYPKESLGTVNSLSISEEANEIIKQIDSYSENISELSNKRKELEDKKDEIQSFELLGEIKEYKRKVLELKKKFYSLTKDTYKDLLSEYYFAKTTMDSIDNKSFLRKAPKYSFKQIIYTEGWYLIITCDNKLYGNYVKEYENEFNVALNNIKEDYGLELEKNYYVDDLPELKTIG